jgi:hypothetical protein
MQKLLFRTALILVYFLSPNIYFGQQHSPVNRGELEKKLEEYLVKEFQVNYFKSIELGELKTYDFDQILEEFGQPVIYADSPELVELNAMMLEELKKLSSSFEITYFIDLSFGSKTKKSAAFSPTWVLIFFDKDMNIISALNYYP